MITKNLAILTAVRGGRKTTYADAICKQLGAQRWNSYPAGSSLTELVKGKENMTVVLDEIEFKDAVEIARRHPFIHFVAVVNIHELITGLRSSE